MAYPSKVDSSATSFAIAEEESYGTLGGSPIWIQMDPNSYQDFGGQLSKLARNPINSSRQRRKGAISDLDASGGIQIDFTQNNLSRTLQGFFFSNWIEKPNNRPYNGSSVALTAVDAGLDQYQAASGLGEFRTGEIILATGFSVQSNNGLKVASAASATAVTVADGLTTESPAATAKIQSVGMQFASATMDVTIVGGLPRLSRVSGSLDLTTLDLLPGEWLWIGGDTTPTKFSSGGNSCFARVKAVAAAYIEFDKTSKTMQAETGTGKTIQVFWGRVLRNAPSQQDIVRRSYQLERQLGNDGDGVQAEYLVGAVANQLNIDVPTAGKVTAELQFVARDNEQRTGLEGVKGGTRQSLVDGDCFNTTSDFSRIKLSVVDPSTAVPSPLFAFLTELKLNMNNNVTPNKAIGVLGAFEVTAGNFEVSGTVSAYFSSVTAVAAVRNNSDVTLDMILATKNAGILFDIPLLTLGDGRLDVQLDQPIKLPLSIDAAENPLGYTVLYQEFPYLPTQAET